MIIFLEGFVFFRERVRELKNIIIRTFLKLAVTEAAAAIHLPITLYGGWKEEEHARL
jgi:hypothetical protein